MHIKQIEMIAFRRFTAASIGPIPASAKLVVMAGPNGSGKTSLFDAMSQWQKDRIHAGGWDASYHSKTGLPAMTARQKLVVNFHIEPRTDVEFKKSLYIRSAYRNEPDFTATSLVRLGSMIEGDRLAKLIDNDSAVSKNYQRLVSATVAGVYDGTHDDETVRALREGLIGQLRQSMKRVFGNLILEGPGDPLSNGSFYFEKGASPGFHYKNLSGGEKAAFDLMLDIIVKRAEYDDTVFVIDEPEAHMNTRLQATLLQELVDLIPANSQLWIATHSIGMMRKAQEIHATNPGLVAFLDFSLADWDADTVLEPCAPDRSFWLRNLSVALDDMAHLVAPSRIVICEGDLDGSTRGVRSDFDASCLRRIFAGEFPDTDFVSGGNSHDVVNDRLRIAATLRYLLPGVSVIRLVDRDDRNDDEVASLAQDGVRTLSERHLESYLLDDEIVARLCDQEGHPELTTDALARKTVALAASIARNNPADDVKSAAGQFYVDLKHLLEMTGRGSDHHSFLKDTMAALVTSDTDTYRRLRADIFGT